MNWYYSSVLFSSFSSLCTRFNTVLRTSDRPIRPDDQYNNAIQFNKLKVKNANDTAVTLQSTGKKILGEII